MELNSEIESANQSQPGNPAQFEDLSVELPAKPRIIQVRELDKKYTHANPKLGKCTLDCCQNSATHWLTRQNSEYCQSDMVCHQHAKIWMQVRDLVL